MSNYIEELQSGQLDYTIDRGAQDLSDICHGVAAECGWWTNPQTGVKTERNRGELLMLCVSELSEAMEADRKDLMDDHLPHRKGFEVELGDCLIRIFDIAGAYDLDLAGAITEKLKYNTRRKDHTLADRAAGGKKF